MFSPHLTTCVKLNGASYSDTAHQTTDNGFAWKTKLKAKCFVQHQLQQSLEYNREPFSLHPDNSIFNIKTSWAGGIRTHNFCFLDLGATLVFLFAHFLSDNKRCLLTFAGLSDDLHFSIDGLCFDLLRVITEMCGMCFYALAFKSYQQLRRDNGSLMFFNRTLILMKFSANTRTFHPNAPVR